MATKVKQIKSNEAKPAEVWPGMTETAFQRLRSDIGHYADHMGLRDWTLRLDRSPCPDDEDGANINLIEGRKVATISVSRRWNDFTREQQIAFVAHELIHCHFEAAAQIAMQDMAKLTGEAAFAPLRSAFVRAIEYGIDGLAMAVAPHLPAPKGK